MQNLEAGFGSSVVGVKLEAVGVEVSFLPVWPVLEIQPDTLIAKITKTMSTIHNEILEAYHLLLLYNLIILPPYHSLANPTFLCQE